MREGWGGRGKKDRGMEVRRREGGKEGWEGGVGRDAGRGEREGWRKGQGGSEGGRYEWREGGTGRGTELTISTGLAQCSSL